MTNMISYGEIVPYGDVLTEAQENNVRHLLIVMNRIRAEYGMPMRITSGFRSYDEEMRIDPQHPDSLHTRGMAVDVYDPDPERHIWTWCVDHLDFLVEQGVWLESRVYSKDHVHFQTAAPHSGKRIFIP